MQQSAQGAHHQDVESDNGCGERAVHERAVDDEVDGVEAVAQDRDARGNGDRCVRQEVRDNVHRRADQRRPQGVESEVFDHEEAHECGGEGEPFELLPLLATCGPKAQEQGNDGGDDPCRNHSEPRQLR